MATVTVYAYDDVFDWGSLSVYESEVDSFQMLCWEDLPEGFSWVGSIPMEDAGRWTNQIGYIMKHDESETFWRVTFLEGATEMQDLSFDDKCLSVDQVFRREVTKIEFVTPKDKGESTAMEF